MDGTDTMVLNLNGRRAEKAYRRQVGGIIMSSGKKKTIGPRDGIGGGYVACKCNLGVNTHSWIVVRTIGTE